LVRLPALANLKSRLNYSGKFSRFVISHLEASPVFILISDFARGFALAKFRYQNIKKISGGLNFFYKAG